MDFANFLKQVVPEIEKELDLILQKWSEEIKKVDPKLVPLNKLFLKADKGGKRIRGGLVILGYQIASGQKNADIYKVAAVYEIFQTAILIHDDIVDQSPLRRGIPTVYKSLGGKHYGISQAIWLGDMGFFLANKILSETNFSPELKTQALQLFNKVMVDTALGEMLEFENGDPITVARLKTSSYSAIGPLTLGVTLAGISNDDLIQNLSEFGENLGIAFQIYDDIQGVFGKEDKTGKSTSTDIRDGKNTLLFKYAKQQASPSQKDILNKFYGNPKINSKQIAQIRQIFQENGALDYTKAQAVKYVDCANQILSKISVSSEQVKILKSLADYLKEKTN